MKMTCDKCDRPATYMACGGPVKQPAGVWGIDRPYPKNRVPRCSQHRNDDAFFGPPWGWEILKTAKAEEGEG